MISFDAIRQLWRGRGQAGPKRKVLGERRTYAVVLGNGPSLKGFNFRRLEPFDCFGMNVAYRYWDQIGWYPRFYCCLDKVVGLSHADAIGRMIQRADEYGMEAFLLRANLIEELGEIGRSPRVADFDSLKAPWVKRLPITTGSHTALWAASLGYRTLYILGVDCSYVQLVPGAIERPNHVLEVVSAEKNPNYFFDGYQRVGDKYTVPNAGRDTHLLSWRTAAAVLGEMGVEAFNANASSRVDSLPFRSFEDVEATYRG